MNRYHAPGIPAIHSSPPYEPVGPLEVSTQTPNYENDEEDDTHIPHMQRSLMLPEHPDDMHNDPGASSSGQQQLHPDIDGVDPANDPDEVWYDAIDSFEPSFARGRINK